MIATVSNLMLNCVGLPQPWNCIRQREIQISGKIKCAYKSKSQQGWAKHWASLKVATGAKLCTSLWFIQIKNEPTESRTMLEVIIEEYPCLEKLNKLNTQSGFPLQSTRVTWDKNSHSWQAVRWEKALDVEVQPLHSNICQVLGEEDFPIFSENSILVYRPLRKH